MLRIRSHSKIEPGTNPAGQQATPPQLAKPLKLPNLRARAAALSAVLPGTTSLGTTLPRATSHPNALPSKPKASSLGAASVWDGMPRTTLSHPDAMPSKFDTRWSGQPGAGEALFAHRCAKEGADVVFEAGEAESTEEIWAHSLVLAEASSLLRALLNGPDGLREGTERRIKLRNVAPKTLLAFLELVYTGTVQFPDCPRSLAIASQQFAVYIAEMNMQTPDWRDLLTSLGLAQRTVITRGKMAWIGCATAQEAAMSIAELNDRGLQAEIIGSRTVELILDVVELLERYDLMSFRDWAATELQKYIGWSTHKFTTLVLCRAWDWIPSSPYRATILDMVEDVLLADNHIFQRNHDGAMSRFRELVFAAEPSADVGQTTAMQVRLQLLRWGSDRLKEVPEEHTTDEWSECYPELLMDLSEGMQSVLDAWTGATLQGASAKRRKVCMPNSASRFV